MKPMSFDKIAFVATEMPEAQAALARLTAQPDAADLAAAPHRLYGVLPPEDICSAARWRDMALAEIDAALSENRLPVVVGGTGFYIRALTEGLTLTQDDGEFDAVLAETIGTIAEASRT